MSPSRDLLGGGGKVKIEGGTVTHDLGFKPRLQRARHFFHLSPFYFLPFSSSSSSSSCLFAAGGSSERPETGETGGETGELGGRENSSISLRHPLLHHGLRTALARQSGEPNMLYFCLFCFLCSHLLFLVIFFRFSINKTN